MNFKNKKFIILILALGLGVVTLCTAGKTRNKNNTEVIINKKSSRINPTIAATLTEKKAIDIAMKKSGGGTVVEYSLENNHSRVEHEVTIINGKNKHEMEIDDSSGEITKYEQEQIRSNRDEAYIKGLISGAKINLDGAKKIALEKSGGGTVYSYELDIDRGQLYYDIDVLNGSDKYDVEINAQTGEVIYLKKISF